MIMIWSRRRRPALWVRIVRAAAIAGSAAGLAIGAELLRRKLRIGMPRIRVSRNGRTARVRVTVPRTRRAALARS
jgi:hypothetical protein